MQPTAGPPLPHTRSRLTHWLGTAAALAAVVGVTAVVQPAGATASTSPVTTASPGPDPKKAAYPLDCGPWKVGVAHSAAADFDGDGSTETVAVVRCATGTGTPPSGVYVLGHPAAGGAPRIVATLVEPEDQLTVDDLAVRRGGMTATVRGYSSDDVPRCCPDLEREVSWGWRDGRFAVLASPSATAV
ncbi:hypothetical protein GL263_07695 [Streptomyces durbertensis]|uniref:Secreted protein n=1 Tax=Streptomyces durbertensis TaxID=2448886 RepID=A0ABR6EDP0_9ACTN|nr:hypothetical protein [Streptomyces durbertensis]MBB1243445.1 hypothetical protein [Streptomyces durbertensis]